MAFVLHQVIPFTRTITSGQTTHDYTLPTALADADKAFVVFGGITGDAPRRVTVVPTFPNVNTLRFTRDDSGNDITISGYIVEGESGISVRRETINIDSFTAPTVKDVSAHVTDFDKTFVIANSISSFGSFIGGDDTFQAYLQEGAGSPPAIELAVHGFKNSGSEQVVYAQIVEMDNVSVQRNASAIDLDPAVGSITDTITAVDLGKSFLLYSQRQSADIFNPTSKETGIRGRFTATTTVAFDIETFSDIYDYEMRYQVVEFTDDTTVENVAVALAAGVSQDDETITSIDTTRSFATFGGQGMCSGQGQGKSTYDVDNDVGETSARLSFTSATNLRINRGQTGGAYSGEAFVIEFPGSFTSIGLASETDTAFPVTHAKTVDVGQATESNTAFAVSLPTQAIVGQAVETDTAGSINIVLPIGELSDVARAAALAQETGEVFLVLLTISHDDIIGGPIRVVNNTEDILSRGNTFIAFPFELQLPDDSTERAPLARLSIDNISREIAQAIRTITSPPTVTIELILADAPDDIELSLPEFTLRNVTWDVQSVAGDLMVQDLISEPYPVGVYDPSRFPALF